MFSEPDNPQALEMLLHQQNHTKAVFGLMFTRDEKLAKVGRTYPGNRNNVRRKLISCKSRKTK